MDVKLIPESLLSSSSSASAFLSKELTDSDSEESLNEYIVDEGCEKSVKENVIIDDKEVSLLNGENIINRLNNCYKENEEKLYSNEVNEEQDRDKIESKVIIDNEKEIICCKNFDNLNDRISSLNNVVSSLKYQLVKELSLWQNERKEYQILQDKTDLFALEEATAAARAAAEAYAAESPLSNHLNIVQYNCCEILDVNPEQTFSELTILEYEKKLAKYQDGLAFSQAEKRYNMRRQLAANTYRKKLIEVERLCDEELEKIKENANSLKPLKKIISQWYSDDNCSGDADKLIDEDPYKSFVINSPRQNVFYSKSKSFNFRNTNDLQIEVNMAPEIISAKFNADKICDVSLRDDINERKINSFGNDYDTNNFISQSIDTLSMLKLESSNYPLPTSL